MDQGHTDLAPTVPSLTFLICLQSIHLLTLFPILLFTAEYHSHHATAQQNEKGETLWRHVVLKSELQKARDEVKIKDYTLCEYKIFLLL